MTTIERNAAVQSGYYFNPTTFNVALVERDGQRLPDERGRYVAIPAIAALALTPVLGALFLVFLPMLGFALCAEAASKNFIALFSGSAGELAVAVAPGWVPGQSHLAGKAARRGERKVEIDPLDVRLDALEREIARRRGL